MLTPDTATPVFVVVLPRTMTTSDKHKRDVAIRRTRTRRRSRDTRTRTMSHPSCIRSAVASFRGLRDLQCPCRCVHGRTRSTHYPRDEKLRAHGYGGGTAAGDPEHGGTNLKSQFQATRVTVTGTVLPRIPDTALPIQINNRNPARYSPPGVHRWMTTAPHPAATAGPGRVGGSRD